MNKQIDRHTNIRVHRGRLNARVMETAGKAFYGVWNVHVMETVCKRPGTEMVGNGNGV